ncbi:MAG: COR domain-containing protein [Candidatus Electronema sp. VV]
MTNEELLKVIEEAKASGATVLNLSNKGITTLPHELFQLTSLTDLFLSRNQLTILPPEFCQLTNLTLLALSLNQLASLPPELCQLKNLTSLDLWGNQLTSLPPELCQLTNLTGLNLSSNQLTTLPPELFQLTNLTKLNVIDNPLISPPPEIARKGIDAIRRYFDELDKGKQPLNEVKILLIGDGAAGKTSLVKQLFGQPFDQHEDTTHGISIRGWEQKVGGRQIRINIWDFGGQEIQHATHQFFLSRRSLYVLVLDSRRDDKTEYWLQYIQTFGGSSPVLVVLNKEDENPSFDVNRPFLLQKYPGIRHFFRTCCADGRGINRFKEVLLDELAKVEMIGIRWPQSWFQVKQRIEQADKPYISCEEYESICAEAGITEEQNREVLVGFLHDLGAAVHFDDYVLNAMHVLDPIWVTQAVYKIITAKEMADSKGLLRLERLAEILRQNGDERHSWPVHTHVFILELMKKFQLCWGIGEQAVLLPQLLPVAEPEFTFDYSGALGFVLHYHDFLPPSVFPRFMVKVHQSIKPGLCWRTGVVLEDTASGSLAAVKADIEARRIRFWVHGPRRKEYLTFLWFSLREINDSFKQLNVSERIPMPDAPHVTADYQTLLNCLKEGMERYMPDRAEKSYSVKELLGLVEPENHKQLMEALRMLGKKIDEKDILELKPNWNGLGIDLKELFRRLRTGEKLL